MKLTIVYTYSDNAEFPYVTTVNINGMILAGVSSRGYKEAEEHLIKRVKKYLCKEKTPQPKEIDI